MYFKSSTKQTKLKNCTSDSNTIYEISTKLFKEHWNNIPIRLIGIRLSDFTKTNEKQLSLFDQEKDISNDKIQEIIDNISDKYGESIIIPASMKIKDE